MTKSYTSNKPTRSEKYQHIYSEISYSTLANGLTGEEETKFLESLFNSELHIQSDQFQLYVKDKLYSELIQLIKVNSTPKQWKVFELIYLKGFTQMEAAEVMNLNNNSSIHKSLFGNTDYNKEKLKKNKGQLKVYGGLFKKISRIAQESPVIINLLQQLQPDYCPTEEDLQEFELSTMPGQFNKLPLPINPSPLPTEEEKP